MNEKKKTRLFVDMDGTLAEFRIVDTLETLYEEGYFFNLRPHENVVEAVNRIVLENEDIEVFILSAYLTDSEYALDEKNVWIDRYLPGIDKTHRIFVPCGTDKAGAIDLRDDDFLLDDYTINLNAWEPPAKGIKLVNAINDTHKSWKSERVRFDDPAEVLKEKIENIIYMHEKADGRSVRSEIEAFKSREKDGSESEVCKKKI